ncbi:YPDG domain-containing protein, partial [Corynebacterium lehmanniae]|nr:YPDG domain-containing protein [Corynebacterium lehmanniae]
MKKNYIARRRGTSVAAAALSFALVAPFAQPVAYAQEPPAAEADQNTDAPQADVSTTDVPTNGGDEKAIYSPGQASQKGTISGSVKEIVEAKIGFGNVQDSGKPLEGVKVYAQWYEGAKTQHSSPVYYTESDANGNFTINMAPYVDAAGVARKFEADASVGETVPQRDHKREKIRVWTELPEDMKDKYRLVHQPAAGIFPAIGDVATPTLQGDGPWGGNKVSEMTIQYAQKDKLPQHLPEEKWAESVGKASNNGTYAGRAFWNLHVLLGGLNHNAISDFNSKDLPAPGMKVVGSYLNDEAVTKIEEHVKSNFAGKTLRGRDWTTADEAGLQKWINEQVAADPEGWIAETVTTTTGADGRFALKWKGLYGNNHTGTGGGINPDADKLHKLAGSWEEGSWLNGNKNSKHVNMDWSYISIYDKDGNPLPDNIGTLYPWALGNWAGPTRGGANAQLFGGGTTFIEPTVDGYTGWNIALVPQALKFDVVDKNTTDNWANLGDKVQTYTAGLPISDDLNYYIEWFDKDGNSVKTCETAKADAATKIPSCELEVPADAQTGDTYTARLKVADGDPDPKNDLVLALDAFAVSRDYLEYDPVDAKKDEEATSEPKFDNPETGPEETKPDQAKFELGKLPEGVTEDQVAVDPATGVVTFTPNADQAGKTFDFPVVMRDEALQVPVLDENGDPVKDESGNPKNQGRIVARADATFKVADLTANTVEPAYEGKLVVPGEETKSAPTFTDKEGKDVTAPEGSKFKITDGFTAPDGYEVKIDENTGEITVTFPDKSKLSKDTVEEFDVPVTVTYPDGSTDKADAKFKLDTDGDGTLDSKDGDDDNDGFTDEEEKDAGTNPKDPSESPAKAALEDKTVVEGKPVDPVKVDATVPAEGTVSVTGLPEGLSYNPETGEITGTPTKLSDWGKTEETRDFPVKVEVKDKDGKVVATDEASWTVQRDTDGDGEPDVIDEDDDNDGFTDEQEKEAGTDPKNPSESPAKA